MKPLWLYVCLYVANLADEPPLAMLHKSDFLLVIISPNSKKFYDATDQLR